VDAFTRPVSHSSARPTDNWNTARCIAMKTGFWRLACSLALAASLSVSAGADTEPGGDIPADSNSTEVVESPDDDSRSVKGYRVQNDSKYPWFMPMFGVEMCSKIDGCLCGIVIRVGTKVCSLAPVSSASRATDTLNEAKEDAGPGVFGIDAPDKIDISKPKGGDSYWAPEFKQMVRHNIGLYQIYVQKAGYFLMPEGGYPNKVPRLLQTKKGEIKNDYRILSCGHRKDGDKGIDAPMRFKNHVPVKRIKCKDYLCNIETLQSIVDDNNPGRYLWAFIPS
jgi:hypothetical protein